MLISVKNVWGILFEQNLTYLSRIRAEKPLIPDAVSVELCWSTWWILRTTSSGNEHPEITKDLLDMIEGWIGRVKIAQRYLKIKYNFSCKYLFNGYYYIWKAYIEAKLLSDILIYIKFKFFLYFILHYLE